jgi:hypothetical protein
MGAFATQVEILVLVLLTALASEAIAYFMTYRHQKYKDTLAKVREVFAYHCPRATSLHSQAWLRSPPLPLL